MTALCSPHREAGQDVRNSCFQGTARFILPFRLNPFGQFRIHPATQVAIRLPPTIGRRTLRPVSAFHDRGRPCPTTMFLSESPSRTKPSPLSAQSKVLNIRSRRFRIGLRKYGRWRKCSGLSAGSAPRASSEAARHCAEQRLQRRRRAAQAVRFRQWPK
jgi:hypothetical protein